MLNFDFLRKALGIVSEAHFVYDFSGKMFFMLYSVKCPNFIVCFPLLPEIMDNMFVAIVCFSGDDVINFETNLIFLLKPFFCITKNLRQKFKHLENEKNFSGEIKITFYHF